MSGLVDAARAAAARGFSYGIRHIGWLRGSGRLRNWLIPPTHRLVGWIMPWGESRLAIVPVPVPRPTPPPYVRGTSRPQAPSIGWSYPAPVTFDSTVFGAPVSPLHSWPRRVFIMTVAVAAAMFCSTTGFGQCCGPGCGSGGCGSGCWGSGGCGSCGIGPSMCSPGPCSPGPGCCCPSGGCGFGCSAGCGCPRSPFGFGLFGGGRCGSPCGSCCGQSCCSPSCGPICGGPCGGGCGSVCGPRCAPFCGGPCGSPCGPCGCRPCGGSYCGGPACGLACGPCAPGACGAGCCAPGGCGSYPPSCVGTPSPCGPGCCPTFETGPAFPPGSTNPSGYPPGIGPGEPIPGVPSTPIPKRPSLPPDDKGTRFERRPVGSSSTAAALDVTDNSQPSRVQPNRTEIRLCRQSASAGFHTQILTAQNSRTVIRRRVGQPLPFSRPADDELARSE
jgi:hypothetical protein